MATPKEATPVATTFKKPKERSAAYAAFTLASSLEFTKNIYSNFGTSSYNTRETIAKFLKKSAEYLKQPISTAVQYGFLELKSNVGYKPSARFMELYKQDDETIVRKTLLAAFKEPKLNRTLLDKYKGDIVPPLPVLANNLFRNHGIIENTAEKAANIFLQNLDDLQLLSPERKLIDPDSEESETVIPVKSEDTEVKDEVIDEYAEGRLKKETEPVSDLSFIIEVPLQGNRKAKILCPIDVNDKDLKKIRRVIKSYMDEEDEDD